MMRWMRFVMGGWVGEMAYRLSSLPVCPKRRSFPSYATTAKACGVGWVGVRGVRGWDWWLVVVCCMAFLLLFLGEVERPPSTAPLPLLLTPLPSSLPTTPRPTRPQEVLPLNGVVAISRPCGPLGLFCSCSQPTLRPLATTEEQTSMPSFFLPFCNPRDAHPRHPCPPTHPHPHEEEKDVLALGLSPQGLDKREGEGEGAGRHSSTHPRKRN